MSIKTFQVLSAVSLFSVLLLGFQNCSQTHFVHDDATFASKGSIEGEPHFDNSLPEPMDELVVTPLDEVMPPIAELQQPSVTTEALQLAPVPPIEDESDNFLDFYSGICKPLQGVTLPLSISEAAADISAENTTDSIVIPEARHVSIRNHVSQTRIYKAQSLTLENLAGKTIVSANEVPSVKNALGRLCINAVRIGEVKNVAIDTKIIANEIHEISNIAGRIHIYRATVGLVKNSVGRICLHDGARVLKKSNSILAKVGRCD